MIQATETSRKAVARAVFEAATTRTPWNVWEFHGVYIFGRADKSPPAGAVLYSEHPPRADGKVDWGTLFAERDRLVD